MLSKAIFRHATLVALLLPTLAHASLITGTLAIGSINGVIISAPGGVGNVQFIANGSGDAFTVNTSSSSGTFVPSTVPASDPGKLPDQINQTNNPVNTFFTIGAGYQPGFMTLDGTPLTFTLQEILGGSYSALQCASTPALAGQVCTPPNTPYSLTNTGTFGQSPTGSTASFSILGTFGDGIPADSAVYSGLFQTTFSGQSYQQVLTQIGTVGSITTSFSATFTPVAPIPETGPLGLVLSGLGLMGLSMLRRKKVS